MFIVQLFYNLMKGHEVAEAYAFQIFWGWQCSEQRQLFQSWVLASVCYWEKWTHSPKGPVFLYHIEAGIHLDL